MISLAYIGVGLGAGLVLLGAGIGIGLIGMSSVTAVSRQPDAKGPIMVDMIISAALIEGVALFGLAIMIILSLNLGEDTLGKFAQSQSTPATAVVEHK